MYNKSTELTLIVDENSKFFYLFNDLLDSNQKILIAFTSKNENENFQNLLIFLHQLLEFFEVTILSNHKIKNEEIKRHFGKIHTYYKDVSSIDIYSLAQFFDDENKNKKYRDYTLSFPIKRSLEEIHILLGMKKRGFGKNYYNGFGGKKEEKETFEECAFREVKEECNIDIQEISLRGKLFFEFEDKNILPIKGHVYEISKFDSEIKESEEMYPIWFTIPSYINLSTIKILNQTIPFHQMWEDDIFWFPFFINKNDFYAKFYLDLENHIQSMKILIKDKK